MQQTLTLTMNLVVNSVLQVTTTTLPAATQNQAYSFQMSVSGGTAPYTWSATGLPAGLSMSSSGLLSGTPTVAGTSSVSVSVTDSGLQLSHNAHAKKKE
jgi:hypothetical protein